MEQELWKRVPNTRGKYWVSNMGRVKSFYAKNPAGRILKARTNYDRGYLYVHLYTPTGTKPYYVHRLVASAFCRKAKLKVQVDHVNGQRLDNRASNLEWVTAAENTRRLIVSGRMRLARSGEGTNRRLTESQVIKLKHDLRQKKYTRQETAEYYGISLHTISAIMQGQRWKHIP